MKRLSICHYLGLRLGVAIVSCLLPILLFFLSFCNIFLHYLDLRISLVVNLHALSILKLFFITDLAGGGLDLHLVYRVALLELRKQSLLFAGECPAHKLRSLLPFSACLGEVLQIAGGIQIISLFSLLLLLKDLKILGREMS